MALFLWQKNDLYLKGYIQKFTGKLYLNRYKKLISSSIRKGFESGLARPVSCFPS